MNDRRQQRHSIELRALLRIPSTRLETACEVTDISAGGVGLRFRNFIQAVAPNQPARLRIDDIGALHVTIRWSSIDRAGASIDADSPFRHEFAQLVNAARQEQARHWTGAVDKPAHRRQSADVGGNGRP